MRQIKTMPKLLVTCGIVTVMNIFTHVTVDGVKKMSKRGEGNLTFLGKIGGDTYYEPDGAF